MDLRELFKETLVDDLQDLHIRADISIDELAESFMEVLENLDGRSCAEMFGKCPMCMDCPDNCLIEKNIKLN